MTPSVQLQLEAEAVLLRTPTGVAARIEAGGGGIAQRFFAQRVDAAGLERAIEWIEDRIQVAHFQPPADARAFSHDAGLRELAQHSGVAAGASMALHLDAVERSFGRLVLQAHGQGAPQDGLPTSARFAAKLVLLRELMHHLHIPQIEVLPALPEGTPD